jgi:hypothetical protein
MDEIIVSGVQRFDRVAHAEIHGAPGMARALSQGGSNPAGVELTIVMLGADTRHCVIRDVHDVQWWAEVNGGGTPHLHGTIYDVRVFNIGWQSTAAGDREAEAGGHGQAVYIQHYGATGQKVIDTCVLAAGFSWMKIYGTNGHIDEYETGVKSRLNKLSGVLIQHTIFVGKGFLVGGVSYGADAIDIHDCAFLDCVLRMGYSGQNGIGAVSDCLLTQGMVIACRVQAGTKHATSGRLVSWEALEFEGNVVIIPKGAAVDVTYDSPAWVWNGNTYYSEEEKPFVLRRENPNWNPLDPKSPKMLPAQRLTFAEWRVATGFDANSEYHEGLPTAPMVREYAVEGLDKKTANVAVYNPTRLNTVQIDDDRAVTMTGTTPLPDGWTGGRVAPLPREVLPTYGVFRLEEMAATVEDDAAAKIAALEARLVEREARITEQAAQLGKLTIEVFEMGLDISNRDKRIGEMSARIEVQQKILDAARALWEASGRFGALMGALK